MSVTTYTTVNGQILCQSKDGVVSHFVSDPLGSVVMVRDNSGNTVYEAEYDPYGNVQSETGTNPSEFGYVGTLGYVKDSAFSLYVRARYLLTNLGRWLTKDPLWPSEPAFVYAGAGPSSLVDMVGAKPLECIPWITDKCEVKICTYYNIGSPIPQHQYVCANVNGKKSCSLGYNMGPSDSMADTHCVSHSFINPIDGKRQTILCETKSWSCNVAQALCGSCYDEFWDYYRRSWGLCTARAHMHLDCAEKRGFRPFPALPPAPHHQWPKPKPRSRPRPKGLPGEA